MVYTNLVGTHSTVNVIVCWENKSLSSHTLKLAQPPAARASSRARRRLKRWRDHFLKVEASATQFARVDDHWHRSLRVVSVLDWIPLLNCKTWGILIQSVKPPLDPESTISIGEACTLVNHPTPQLWQREEFLTAWTLTSITEFKKPVMAWTQVHLLICWPHRASLHTSPRPRFRLCQFLSNHLSNPLLPLLDSCCLCHSEMIFPPNSELVASTVRNIQICTSWDSAVSRIASAYARTSMAPTSVFSHHIMPWSAKK